MQVHQSAGGILYVPFWHMSVYNRGPNLTKQ